MKGSVLLEWQPGRRLGIQTEYIPLSFIEKQARLLKERQ